MSLKSFCCSLARHARPVLAAGALVAALPLTAGAELITITFDRGYDDTSITDPTGEYHGPYAWIEEGVRVSGFWAEDVGTASGSYGLGHYHPSENLWQPNDQATHGFVAEYTHAYTNDLQGLDITLESGGTFDLVSLRYDIWYLERLDDPQLQRLPWSFGADDPRIIATDSFDPSLSDFESQWSTFSAIYEEGFGDEGNWHTVDFTSTPGFTGLSSVLISQTSALAFIDHIVIDTNPGSNPVPEPSTALLFGLGLMGAARYRRA